MLFVLTLIPLLLLRLSWIRVLSVQLAVAFMSLNLRGAQAGHLVNIGTLQSRIRNSMSRLLILRLMLLVLLLYELLLIQSLPAELLLVLSFSLGLLQIMSLLSKLVLMQYLLLLLVSLLMVELELELVLWMTQLLRLSLILS